MSPFGLRVRAYRVNKSISLSLSLSLSKLAKALSVTPAFLSSLERGKKRRPSKKIVDGVITYFDLDDTEVKEFEDAAKASDIRPEIPSDANPEVYYLIHYLVECAGKLSELEIDVMRVVLLNRIKLNRKEGYQNVYIS